MDETKLLLRVLNIFYKFANSTAATDSLKVGSGLKKNAQAAQTRLDPFTTDDLN